ncbi:MAG: nicotinate-nucleotide adenylyltransferase [Pyrinomonadaceae bacterium]
MKKRVAYYGGSFDPPHRGHIAIAHALLKQFDFDEFIFVPAFHAPHKTRKQPTSAYDRYAMLCLVTQDEPKMTVSRIEIEAPERPYSVETLGQLTAERSNEDIFFVMGADSWEEITTWREWETVLGLTNHIVVTRPGYEIGFDHVTDAIRDRIVDLRSGRGFENDRGRSIFVSNAVRVDVSATQIRHKIVTGDASWRDDVPGEVAKYVEKYQIYS